MQASKKERAYGSESRRNLPEEFFDQRGVAFADIAVAIRRTESNHPVHPVRGIAPKNAATADSRHQVLKVPVKCEARDHRVEQMVGERAFERGGDAPRRAVKPDPGDPRV